MEEKDNIYLKALKYGTKHESFLLEDLAGCSAGCINSEAGSINRNAIEILDRNVRRARNRINPEALTV